MPNTDTSDDGSSFTSSSAGKNPPAQTKKSAAGASSLGDGYTVDPSQRPSMRQKKDKQRADASPSNSLPSRPSLAYTHSSPLSPSMLSSSSYKSVNLNIGGSMDNGPARIITYTKHSQGFTWNDELFLPSYMHGRRYRHGGSRARRRWGDEHDDDEDDGDDFDEDIDHCPVTDVFVTDEEASAMLP